MATCSKSPRARGLPRSSEESGKGPDKLDAPTAEAGEKRLFRRELWK